MSNLIDTIPFIGVRGDVLIETRDARSGKLAQRSEGHNLFTNYGLERFRKYCAYAIGCQFGKNVYFSENSNDQVLVNAGTENGFLKYLYLTDNEAAIAATDSVIPGTLTGWASRTTYTGTDVTRGALNQNESSFTKDGLKAVFDFATDRANGTHKSIFWGDQATLATYNINACIDPAAIEAKLARGYTRLVESDDGYFYGSVGTTLYKIDPITLSELATYTLPATPSSTAIFDVAGGYCYFTTASNSTTLYVFKLSDSTNTTKTLPAVSLTNGGAVLGGYLYYPYATSRVYKFDLTAGTGVYNTVTIPNTDCRIVRIGNNLFTLGSNGQSLYAYDYDTNVFTAVAGCYPPDPSKVENTYSLTNKLWYLNPLLCYTGSATDTVNALQYLNLAKKRANMITGKVLDAPITKSNTQTMKVTYTISFT